MNHRLIIFLSSLLLIAVVVGGVVYVEWAEQLTPALGPPPAEAAPAITWTPDQMTETVAQGQTKTKVISFTSDTNLTNVAVQIVPELSPYVSASPSSFSSISAGATVTITLTFLASADAQLGAFNGTLHLRDNSGKSKKTYAKPLPVTVEVSNLFRDDELGVSFLVPPTLFQVDAGDFVLPLEPGQADTLAIFRSAPEGEPATEAPTDGCFIDIGVENNSAVISLSEWLATYSYRRPEDIDEEVQVGGEIGIRRTGQGEIFGDPFTIVFVPHNEVIYTFTVEAHGDAATIDQCKQDFDQILTSFRFNE